MTAHEHSATTAAPDPAGRAPVPPEPVSTKTGPGSTGPGSADPPGTAGCGASAILARGGPTAVPFELCCVLTILRANGPEAGPAVCRALEMLEVGESLVAEPAP
jgi:hypothetical protein